MKRFSTLIAAATLAVLAVPASADTLYVSAPPAAAPGHPMRLGADHRASQVGDLVTVVFNFDVNSTSSAQTSTANNVQIGLGNGTGLLNLPLVRLGAGIQGGRQVTNAKTQTGQNTFTSTMEATVTDVLPSGAMRIAGDQRMTVNGQVQVLHVTGTVRPQDIDVTDSVLSTKIADVQGNFTGDFQEGRKGILTRVLEFLF